jgi:hypothetical protein
LNAKRLFVKVIQAHAVDVEAQLARIASIAAQFATIECAMGTDAQLHVKTGISFVIRIIIDAATCALCVQEIGVAIANDVLVNE